MMRSFRPWIAGLAGVAAVTLAAIPVNAPASGADGEPKADVIVADAQDGKTIHLKANQLLEVRLAGNRTTGYAWYPVGGRDNDGKAWGNEEVGVLAPSGEHAYLAGSHPKGMVGVGGTDVYHYLARKPGTQTLRFIQVRPWDQKEVAARRSFTVVVAE